MTRRVMLLLTLAAASTAVSQQPAAPQAPARRAQIPVQMGVGISPDTVTVGQRFVVVLKVRAPRGASIQFPIESDSATAASPTATELVGKPVVDTVHDSVYTTATAAYRFAAWDTGIQRLGIGDVIVRHDNRTGYVSTAPHTIYVSSVLPDDSTLRVPKPPRAQIEILPFNWLPWALLLLALLLAGIVWRAWMWYRGRRAKPLPPFEAAEREFARIEAMGLIAAGEGGRHAALMTDVLREYLAARVEGVERSQTSAELVAASGSVRPALTGLGELLWRTDLIKFAGIAITSDEAAELGSSARATVRAVETFVVEAEQASEKERAA